jgi:aryl-alcohol dehydrogenase-like predicted oxidoreductase
MQIAYDTITASGKTNMLETRRFGNTDHVSTRVLFGAAAFYGVTDQDLAFKTMEIVERAGINHIDTAASYGESESRLGPWLKHNRKKVFLATKTEKRTYSEAREGFLRSLDRLCVDSVDLLQLHCLVDPAEWETAMSGDGALRALAEFRQQRLTRYIGVTGHGVTAPAMHLKSIAEFSFDSVMLPYNYRMMQNPAYKKDCLRLFELCREKNIAVQVIKTLAKGPWQVEESERGFSTWYEPLSNQDDIDTAVSWALANPQVFLNTPADIGLLPKVVEAAERFRPGTAQEKWDAAAAEMRTAPLFV